MYPGLKLKLTNEELNALRRIVIDCIELMEVDKLTQFVMKDIAADFLLKANRKKLLVKQSYSITLKPTEMFLIMNGVDVLFYPADSYENNVLLNIIKRIDLFQLNLKQIA